MRLDLNSLEVQTFAVESSDTTTTVAGTGPEGPYSYCWICRDTDPGVPGCDPQPAPAPKPYPYDPFNPQRSYVVDSVCMCYA